MGPNIDRLTSFSRFQLRRIGLPVLVLSLCTFTRAASGQAQLGTGESCFDDGPERLPARTGPSLPAPPAPQLSAAAQLVAQPRLQIAKAQTRKARPASAYPVNKRHLAPQKKPYEGTLTAAR